MAKCEDLSVKALAKPVEKCDEQGVTKTVETSDEQGVARPAEQQRVTAEESEQPARGKLEDAPFLCKNGCGFFGSRSFMNLCSKCYKDVVLEKSRATAVSVAAPLEERVKEVEPVSGSGVSQPRQPPNRCSTCKKRVGLTGFKCRCGSLLCALHRYSNMHDCSFDFKATGRDAIAKANPLIQADKLQKI